MRVRDSGPCVSRSSSAARSFMARNRLGVPGVAAGIERLSLTEVIC